LVTKPANCRASIAGSATLVSSSSAPRSNQNFAKKMCSQKRSESTSTNNLNQRRQLRFLSLLSLDSRHKEESLDEVIAME